MSGPDTDLTTDAKICGVKTVEAVEAAVAGGAGYIGLVFFAKSPRNIGLVDAAALADLARGRTRIVALLVDADDGAIADIVANVRPDVLQLHGAETPERVAAIKRKFGLPVIKALKVATAEDAKAAFRFNAADIILFDAAPPKDAAMPGGHGATFDWSLLASVRGRLPFMLSGGLTPENVTDAIARTGAAAVDVSSGVESAPGVKDPERIRRFLQAVKASKQTA